MMLRSQRSAYKDKSFEELIAPRVPANSVDELLVNATRREPFRTSDARSGSRFERLEIEGERYVLKIMHVDDDWIARSLGDMRCWQVQMWVSGMLDAFPHAIDHAVVGAATGIGRHGWGAALLMRDVGDYLVPPGNAPLPAEQHARFIAHMAELSAWFWGWRDTIGLMPPSTRWAFFSEEMLNIERLGGWTNEVPALAARGWERFDERAPRGVVELVTGLRRQPYLLADALTATPRTFLHGDWKLGNVGRSPDGRTVLLDCTYPGEGPACHELTWYLALNRERIPESKEDTISRFRRELERHGISTGDWWDRQLGLCLLGAVLQFGWEKASDDDSELGWWIDRAREAARWL